MIKFLLCFNSVTFIDLINYRPKKTAFTKMSKYKDLPAYKYPLRITKLALK